MIHPTAAALLLGLAGPALALPWDGTYRLAPGADCGRVGEEGGALRIEGGVFEGVHASCRMTEPVDVLDLDATLYVMECEGDGTTWSERALFMRAAEGDGIYILWRGYAFRYDRCPDPETAATEDAEDADPASSADDEGAVAAEGRGGAGEDGGIPDAEPSVNGDGSDAPTGTEGGADDAGAPVEEGDGDRSDPPLEEGG